MKAIEGTIIPQTYPLFAVYVWASWSDDEIGCHRHASSEDISVGRIVAWRGTQYEHDSGEVHLAPLTSHISGCPNSGDISGFKYMITETQAGAEALMRRWVSDFDLYWKFHGDCRTGELEGKMHTADEYARMAPSVRGRLGRKGKVA